MKYKQAESAIRELLDMDEFDESTGLAIWAILKSVGHEKSNKAAMLKRATDTGYTS